MMPIKVRWSYIYGSQSIAIGLNAMKPVNSPQRNVTIYNLIFVDNFR